MAFTPMEKQIPPTPIPMVILCLTGPKDLNANGVTENDESDPTVVDTDGGGEDDAAGDKQAETRKTLQMTILVA